MQGLDGELRAAMALDALDAETKTLEIRNTGGHAEIRERDTMWEKSDMGRIFAAVVEPGSVDGVAGFWST